jgi:hypothetical protein
MLVGLVVSGCGRSAVSEDEVRERAEEIAGVLLSAAEGVPRKREDIVRSGTRHVETSASDPWRYWQIRVDLVLAQDSPTSPVQVAEEMIGLLRADGWVSGSRADPEVSGVDTTLSKQDVGGSWTVALGGWGDPPPVPQRVFFTVVSPAVDH